MYEVQRTTAVPINVFVMVCDFFTVKITQISISGWIIIWCFWCGGSICRTTLQWCHNGRDSVSNYQHHHCLLNGLFRRRSNKNIKDPRPGPVNSPHKGSVTRKMFPFDDVIMSMTDHAQATQGTQCNVSNGIKCKYMVSSSFALMQSWLLSSLQLIRFIIIHPQR